MNHEKKGQLNLRNAIFTLVFLIFLFLPLFIIHNSLFISAASPDAIATRVMPNPNHLSPLRWYQANIKNKGAPQATQVDGYEAIRDGRTVYVNAANISPCEDTGTCFYTNIYIISYNQQAESQTVDIFGQMLAHWKFNTNIINPAGFCSKPAKVETNSCAGTFGCWDFSSKSDGALAFNGLNDCQVVPNSTSLNVKNNITLEAYINYQGAGSGLDSDWAGMILAKHYTHNSRSYNLDINNTTKKIQFELIDKNNMANILDSVSTIEYNQWYHLVGTYDKSSGMAKIYINGRLDNSSNFGSFDLLQTTVPVTIGCYLNSFDGTSLRSFFKGQISQAKVYDRALSAKEISLASLQAAKLFQSCTADTDCGAGYCKSPKAAIIRDTKRLADLAEINSALEKYAKDNYPRLLSGSYIAGASVSTWPSWQATLGKELGLSLPHDPVNELKCQADCCKNNLCVSASDKASCSYDKETCWNQTNKSFYFNFNPDSTADKSIAKQPVYWYQNGQVNINFETSANYANLKDINGVNFANIDTALYFDPPLHDITVNSGQEFTYQIRVKDPKLTNANQYNLSWSLADNYENMVIIKPTSARNIAEMKIKAREITPLTVIHKLTKSDSGATISIDNPTAMPNSFLFTYKCSSPYYDNPAIDVSHQIDSYYGAIGFTFYFVGDVFSSSHPYDSSLCDGREHQIEINENKKLTKISVTAPMFGISRQDFLSCLTLSQYSFSEFKKISGEKTITVNVLDKNINKTLTGDFKANIYECGNGAVDPGEVCDINKKVDNGQCCESGAYYGNSGKDAVFTVGCKDKPSCGFVVCDSTKGYGWDDNAKTCYEHCGDNSLNYEEQCDGSLGLSGWDCSPGTISCSQCQRTCIMGYNNPYQGNCGDGIIQSPEVCDGSTKTPANAICVNKCGNWECNNQTSPTGFHKDGSQCVSNTRENFKDCLTDGVTKATQTYQNGAWSACQTLECDAGAGYNLTNNQCIKCDLASFPDSVASVQFNARSGKCEVNTCNSGWHPKSDYSACDPDTKTEPTADGHGTCVKNFKDGAYPATCDSVSCDSGYHKSFDGQGCTTEMEVVCDPTVIKNGAMKSTYFVSDSRWGACEAECDALYPNFIASGHPYYGNNVCVNACGLNHYLPISLTDTFYAQNITTGEKIQDCYIQNVLVEVTYYNGNKVSSGYTDSNGNITSTFSVNDLIYNEDKCKYIFTIDTTNASGSGSGSGCTSLTIKKEVLQYCQTVDLNSKITSSGDIANCF